MSLAATSIRRPVLTWVLSAFILLFGLLGLVQLGVREYPAIDPPTIGVTTTYRGANAEVIENQITEPLESSLNGIDGVRSIVSQSGDGRSSITVEFQLGANLEQAANDVRDRVARAQRSLPIDADPPTVAKADANSSPILVLTLASDTRDLLGLSEMGTRIAERMQTIAGVAEVRVWGERRYAMRIRIDPLKLAATGLSLREVQTAMAQEDAELPAGQLEGQTVSLSLRAKSELQSVEDFRGIVLRAREGRVLRLGDVADVELGAENERTILRRNGKPNVGLAVIAQPGANQVEIADEVMRRSQSILADLPKDLQLETAFNNTRFVRSALKEVEETILIAFLLVVGVIFLFLRDWRTTLIPVLTIPISLIGVFSVIWAMGFSINVLTLLGVVLAIGIVVDDAIVVLENVFAKVEAGMAPREAAVKGVGEIFGAVVSTTIVLAAVFTPLLFLQGFTGRLFREFAVVIGGSVLISGFVALTLGGMLSSRLLKAHDHHNRLYRATEPFFVGLTALYARTLARMLARPLLALPILAVTLTIAVLCYRALPSELAPLEDRSFLSVSVSGHEGATAAFMDDKMKQLAAIAQEAVPEATTVLALTAPGQSGIVNSGSLRIMLCPPDQRQRSQQQIAKALGAALAKVDAVRLSVTQDQTIRVGNRGGQPVQLVIQAPLLDSLQQNLPRLMEKVQASSVLTMADADLKFTKPQLDVEMDRNRLRDLGVSPVEVAQALQLAYSGMRYGYFLRDGKQYQILGEFRQQDRSAPQSLQGLHLMNKEGKLLSLDQLVTLKERAVPPQLYRYNRYSAATVSAGLAPGAALNQGIEELRRIVREELGPNYKSSLVGTSRDFMESSGSLAMVFLLALLIVYLILAAQFESFRNPLVIMLTVPLALSGALASLWLFGLTLNLFSQIGLVMLVGLVTKNGILIVEFANQRLRAGRPLIAAVAEAAEARLRPILMTTLATIFGFLPIAMALGAGSESRSPMGIAVIGGLIVSLALSLFVVPAMYLVLAHKAPAPTTPDSGLTHEGAR